MATQVSGRFPDRGGRRLLQGQAPRSGSQTGRGGLTAFGVIRSASGPRKSKSRRKPTPNMCNWRSQMTLIKSLLLGSAAGIVAVATAQAADLPTRKAAPVEYVRVCNVGGITGWTLPGSDTCVKFSGYMTAHVIGGNLASQYNSAEAIATTAATALDPFAPAHLSQVLMVQGSDVSPTVFNGAGVPITVGGVVVPAGAALPGGIAIPKQKNAIFNRSTTGWKLRASFGFDLASNTAYGPLIGHFDLNSDLGNGFDGPNGSVPYVNTGYVTWAGITAGKAQSFFSFIGGGDNW